MFVIFSLSFLHSHFLVFNHHVNIYVYQYFYCNSGLCLNSLIYFESKNNHECSSECKKIAFEIISVIALSLSSIRLLRHLLLYRLKVYDSINSSENLNLSVTNTGLMAAL